MEKDDTPKVLDEKPKRRKRTTETPSDPKPRKERKKKEQPKFEIKYGKFVINFRD